MLKRYQVLLSDWQEDYMKHLIKIYDLSISELIRAEICCSTICSVLKIYPEYKAEISIDDIFKFISETPDSKTEKDQLAKMLSKIYFEARKAAEFRLEKEKASIS